MNIAACFADRYAIMRGKPRVIRPGSLFSRGLPRVLRHETWRLGAWRFSNGSVANKEIYYYGRMTRSEEVAMPVILLWGIPTLIVLGGGTCWLLHLHH